MQFTKAHGCGNDFIILDLEGTQEQVRAKIAELRDEAPGICDRHKGVGADGLLLVTPTLVERGARYEMTVINSDGSLAEMCGNGLRCVADFLRRSGRLCSGEELKTGAGELRVHFSDPPEGVAEAERASLFAHGSWVGAELSAPQGVRRLCVSSDPHSEQWHLTCLSLGNPHAVTFDPEAFARRAELAPALSGQFEGGVNLSFARLESPGLIQLHVHERGCGWTQACGTGACATAVAAVEWGLAKQGAPLTITLPGGQLVIEYSSEGLIMMWGPALEVFRGALNV